jgi:hypothetical protein
LGRARIRDRAVAADDFGGKASDCPAAEPPSTPESRAITYLAREVPRWHAKNHCYSCHNNGDAARALYRAMRLGDAVPPESLTDTSAWLVRPDGWDKNGGEGPFSDKRLARIQFAAALAAGVEAGVITDYAALRQAAQRLVADQADDGHWPIDDADTLGSPATYGQPLASVMAREALLTADPARFRAEVGRADHWLRHQPIRNVLGAAAVLRACATEDHPDAIAQRTRCLDLIRRAQSPDGGWGPYTTSPSEPFDTAVVLLGLVRCGQEPDASAMIKRGRSYLISAQIADGSWPETTRPAGAESYAQRISTSGWATLALLATRP